MATDIRLDGGDDQNIVDIDCEFLRTSANDVVIDAPKRRSNRTGYRRALIHDHNDGLTINYNGDYPGGVRIIDAMLNLRVVEQDSVESELPLDAPIGTLMLVINRNMIGGDVIAVFPHLWLCTEIGVRGRSLWREVQLGDPT